MRKPVYRVIGLGFSTILFAVVVSGCFQTAGASVDLTATTDTPTATVTPQPALPQQPVNTPIPQPPVPQPTLPTAIAQDATLIPQPGGVSDQDMTATLAQATNFAEATRIIDGITQTAAFVNTQAAAAAQPQPQPGQNPGNPPTQPPVAPPNNGAAPTPIPTVEGTPGAPGSGAAGPITADCIYTVVDGDRLFRIAMRFNLTVEDVARANGIVNPDLILPDQKFTIPNCNATPAPITPTPIPAGANGAPGAPGTTPVAGGSGQSYVVTDGDTLYSIAMKYGVKVMALAQANNIGNINLIYIGQTLVIP